MLDTFNPGTSLSTTYVFPFKPKNNWDGQYYHSLLQARKLKLRFSSLPQSYNSKQQSQVQTQLWLNQTQAQDPIIELVNKWETSMLRKVRNVKYCYTKIPAFTKNVDNKILN